MNENIFKNLKWWQRYVQVGDWVKVETDPPFVIDPGEFIFEFLGFRNNKYDIDEDPCFILPPERNYDFRLVMIKAVIEIRKMGSMIILPVENGKVNE
ncbi:MAG: hypothetical protein ACYDAO_04455 [Thermoplasmataceae archaeon]